MNNHGCAERHEGDPSDAPAGGDATYVLATASGLRKTISARSAIFQSISLRAAPHCKRNIPQVLWSGFSAFRPRRYARVSAPRPRLDGLLSIHGARHPEGVLN